MWMQNQSYSQWAKAKPTRVLSLWSDQHDQNHCTGELGRACKWEAKIRREQRVIYPGRYSSEGGGLLQNRRSFPGGKHFRLAKRRRNLPRHLCYGRWLQSFRRNRFPEQRRPHPELASWWLLLLRCWVINLSSSASSSSSSFLWLLLVFLKKKMCLKFSMDGGQWTSNSRNQYNLRDAIARCTTQVDPNSCYFKKTKPD